MISELLLLLNELGNGEPHRIFFITHHSALFLLLIAALSASIGFINLLPIPVLDGGHLMFYAIEGLIRRPLSDGFKEMGFKFGLALLLTLMLFTTVTDVTKLWRLLTGNV